MTWGLVAVAGIGLIGGIAQGQAQKSAAKDQNQLTQQDQELNFQRQDYLAQQQRLWQLQDRQFKQQAIGGFDKFWTPSGVTPPNQNAQMGQLDQFDPNKLGSVGQNQPPPAPLQQLNPGQPVQP